MFYNTHTYIASEAYGKKDNLLITGSFIPDITVTEIIDWRESLHEKDNIDKFSLFIKDKHSKYIDLSNGIYTHYLVDELTHHKYKGKTGYSYQNNKDLVSLVKKYYNVNDNLAQRKTHNLIECGVERLLLDRNKDIQTSVLKIIKEVDREELSRVLGDYFNVDIDSFRKAIDFYFKVIKESKLENDKDWIVFWKKFEKVFGVDTIGEEKIKKILDAGVDIVRETHEEFINTAINDLKHHIDR